MSAISGYMPWLNRRVPGPTPGYVMPLRYTVIEAYERSPKEMLDKRREKIPDLVGEVFGDLKVVGIYSDHHRGRRWECECQVPHPDGDICGKRITVPTSILYSGLAKSCGRHR